MKKRWKSERQKNVRHILSSDSSCFWAFCLEANLSSRLSYTDILDSYYLRGKLCTTIEKHSCIDTAKNIEVSKEYKRGVRTPDCRVFPVKPSWRHTWNPRGGLEMVLSLYSYFSLGKYPTGFQPFKLCLHPYATFLPTFFSLFCTSSILFACRAVKNSRRNMTTWRYTSTFFLPHHPFFPES